MNYTLVFALLRHCCSCVVVAFVSSGVCVDSVVGVDVVGGGVAAHVVGGRERQIAPKQASTARAARKV